MHRQIGSLIALAGLSLVITSPAGAAPNPWRITASPNRGRGTNELYAVSAASTSSAWAIGVSTNSRPLVEHWNGTAWTITDIAAMNTDTLETVTTPSAHDVWIAGYSSAYQPLLLHYDGTAWTRTLLPSLPAGQSAPVTALTASSATDVWTLGQWSNSTGPGDKIYLDHWNGTAWRKILIVHDGRGCFGAPVSLDAVSHSDVWFTIYRVCGAAATEYIAAYWNGHEIVTPPGAPTGPSSQHPFSYEYDGLAASSPSNVWVVGSWQNTETIGPLAGFYDGSGWTSTQPNFYPTSHSLLGVATTGPSSVWAVGFRTGGDSGNTFNLLEFWNGSSWSQEWGGPNPSSDSDVLHAVAPVPGTSDYWAVGDAARNTSLRTMILQCCS